MKKIALLFMIIILPVFVLGCSRNGSPSDTSIAETQTSADETELESFPMDYTSFPADLEISDLADLYARLKKLSSVSKTEEYEGYWFVFYRLDEWGDNYSLKYSYCIDRINPQYGERDVKMTVYDIPEFYTIEKYNIVGPDRIHLVCHAFECEMGYPKYCEIYFNSGTADADYSDFCAVLKDDGYLMGGTLQISEFEDFRCDFTRFGMLFDIIDGETIAGDAVSTVPETQVLYDEDTNSISLVIGKVSLGDFKEGDLGLSNTYIDSASLKKDGDGAVISLKLSAAAAYYRMKGGYVPVNNQGKTDGLIEYLEINFYPENPDPDQENYLLTSGWYELGKYYWDGNTQKRYNVLEGSIYDIKTLVDSYHAEQAQ